MTRRIPQLDVLRTLAIACVLFMHIGHYSGFNATPAGRLTAHLNLGVPIFFVLSGFVLYRPFMAALVAARPMPSLGRYAVRRALRLLPAYWVALGVLAFWPGLPGVRASTVWRYATLVQSWHRDWYFGGIAAAWSLSIELMYSALLPLWVGTVFRLTWSPSAVERVRRAAVQCVLLAVFGLTCRGVGASVSRVLADGVFGHLFYFALGMLLSVAEAARQASVWQPARSFGGGSLGLAGLMYLAHCVVFPTSDLRAPLSPTWAIVEQVSFGAIAVLLALVALFGGEANEPAQRVLTWPPLVTLGLWSYGVFLWHQPPLAYLATHGPKFATAPAFVWLAICTAPVAVLMGWLSHRFVERPALHVAERWTARLDLERA